MVLPGGYDPKTSSQPSSQPPSTAAPGKAQPSGPKESLRPQSEFAVHPPVAANRAGAIAAAAIVVVILSVGAIIWLRSGAPAINEAQPPPRTSETAKPGDSGPRDLAPQVAPGQNPDASESGLAKHSNGELSTGTSPTARQGDVAGGPQTAPGSLSRRLRLLVPVYIYPAGDGRKEWQRLLDAASKVEIVAIVNPSSGPGDDQNSDYAAIFTEASNLRIALVGYVSTDYCKRPQPQIKKDIDTWLRLYPQIRGFFFDQQPRERQHVARFVELREYAKQKLPEALVITNPGVPCDDAYLAQAVSNLTCVFVNFEGFDRFELPLALRAYDPFRFAAMPYNIAGVEAMRTALKDAIIKRIGYVFISDGKPPVHWDKLPAYWEAEVDAVSRLR
jgi:hypothetical protein